MSMEKITSEFIVRTCQLLRKSYDTVSDRTLIQSTNCRSKKSPMYCGSSAEFYIRPLNPCVDDVDILISFTDQLVFCEDFPVIPNNVSGLPEMIQCFNAESYHRYPGFVRLKVLGEMNYNWKYKKYEFNSSIFQDEYVGYDQVRSANESVPDDEKFKTSTPHNTVRGPAISCEATWRDFVYCICCPRWPKEAQDWTKRLRDYGWPTIDTISKVVQNGCHVVYAQHRACRDDELQWRFSFSGAEVILIQSWTKLQQIVYHLLRFFAKRELIQKDCPKEDEVLCPYHLKTLMLWNCEKMSPEWWNSSSVIAICCKLLQKLSLWLKKRYFPNYFISEANLFHEPSSCTMLDRTERRINEFRNSETLCHWFVENYILPFTRKYFAVKCTPEVKPHFADIMLPLLTVRKTLVFDSIDFSFRFGFAVCNDCFARFIIKRKLILGLSYAFKRTGFLRKHISLTNSLMSFLPTTENDMCFTYFDATLYNLQAAYYLSCGSMSWDSELFVEYVKGIFLKPKIVRRQYHVFPAPFFDERSLFNFLQAKDLMEALTGSNSCSELKLVCLMSKEFLRKALECDDSQSNIIAPAAFAYLAALHFATSEYQIVMDLCSAVLMDQTIQTENETLDASCLFFIDDIARIVGFCLLCKKFSANVSYSKKLIYLDLRLTPKFFAHHLSVISAERISKQLEMNHVLPFAALPLDKCFLVLIQRTSNICFKPVRHCVYRRTGSMITTSNTSLKPSIVKEKLIVKKKLIVALEEHALENIASFYSAICKDFGIQCNTIDCYRALYHYKCCQYDDVLRLCERILHEPDLQSDLKKFAFANVLLLPPLDSFFDVDVQSLLGFHTLFHCLSPKNDEKRKFELTDNSTSAQCFTHYDYSNKDPFSAFLGDCTSGKCCYFIGRHFLASYLKFRCCIDCNHQRAKLIAEFGATKINLPFEHIICKFTLQKLRKCIK